MSNFAMKEVMMMSKHQEIIAYLEKLPVGKRVSVRSISNYLGVSDGTAYRAIKEAENRGLVETRPRSGTVRVKSTKVVLEHLTYHEIAEITRSEVLAGQAGLDKEFSKFSIGAMTEQNIMRYLTEGGLLIVGDRTEIQRLALKNENAVLVTGGFSIEEDILSLADQMSIPILRTQHDTYTVATIINRALSNIQIKTDILTVEQVYRSAHEHGFLQETDTVKDYLDLVRKNRSSRFPVINQHQMVVGVVTMRDAGDKSPYTTLDKIMTKNPFMTGLKTNIANVSQRMIAEDFEMIPVVRSNQTLLGVITRRDILEKMSREQVSSLPTFSDQITQKLIRNGNDFAFTVEPFMLENNGVLSHGVLTEILNTATHQLISYSGRSLIIENMMIYFLQAVQLDDYLTLQSRLVRETRRSAIIDYEIYLEHQLVAKATITVKIN
ncbi:DRTGG domain protein [Streptococcus sp. oral taxon 056 str. F0418]|nr:DRTGG domain protein [Streptococcus sp. oral taxon 056 str. F0418]